VKVAVHIILVFVVGVLRTEERGADGAGEVLDVEFFFWVEGLVLNTDEGKRRKDWMIDDEIISFK
jgi:hypothetical protein